MEKSKVKNLVIIILVLVDLFLMTIVISDAVKANSANRYKTDSVKAVFADNDIIIDDSVDLTDELSEALFLRRDETGEKYRAARLIGDCTTEDLGGNIYRYTGSEGQATFRGTGEFEIFLLSDAFDVGGDFVAASREVLDILDIEYARGEEPAVSVDNGKTTVTLTCAYDGVPIYNAQVRFTYLSDYLKTVSGRKPLDEANGISSSQGAEDSITALMSFLSYVRSGQLCTEISALDPGYSVQTQVSGDCVLNPVWCITTDTGRYYVDGFTGKTEKIID